MRYVAQLSFAAVRSPSNTPSNAEKAKLSGILAICMVVGLPILEVLKLGLAVTHNIQLQFLLQCWLKSIRNGGMFTFGQMPSVEEMQEDLERMMDDLNSDLGPERTAEDYLAEADITEAQELADALASGDFNIDDGPRNPIDWIAEEEIQFLLQLIGHRWLTLINYGEETGDLDIALMRYAAEQDVGRTALCEALGITPAVRAFLKRWIFQLEELEEAEGVAEPGVEEDDEIEDESAGDDEDLEEPGQRDLGQEARARHWVYAAKAHKAVAQAIADEPDDSLRAILESVRLTVEEQGLSYFEAMSIYPQVFSGELQSLFAVAEVSDAQFEMLKKIV